MPHDEKSARHGGHDPKIVRDEHVGEVVPLLQVAQQVSAVRETGRRVLNMRHFDVQIIGGAVLHKGRSPR